MTMQRYLYVFGFESPEERECNEVEGTDYESSRAVFILAESRNAALVWGQRLACAFVHGLFNGDRDSWTPQNYANWIEDSPDSEWDLSTLPEITAEDEDGLQAIAQGWIDNVN